MTYVNILYGIMPYNYMSNIVYAIYKYAYIYDIYSVYITNNM